MNGMNAIFPAFLTAANVSVIDSLVLFVCAPPPESFAIMRSSMPSTAAARGVTAQRRETAAAAAAADADLRNEAGQDVRAAS